MTDEHKRTDEPLVPEEAGAAPATPQAPVDPWAQAFDELEDKPAADPAGSEGGDKNELPRADGDGSAGQAVAPAADGTPAVDTTVGDSDAGGSLPAGGGDGSDAGGGSVDDVAVVVENLQAQIERRTLEETTQMFLDRADETGRKLIRQSGGQLGATINDKDIYRVGEDGTAQFFNPDTNRPFSGDNPRAQAKAWVDAYNDELRDTFNRMAGQRNEEIAQEMAPVIEMLKFTPTYDALDDTRQKMLDAILADYEVFDEENNHIGYSVDLNKALEQVNRQVTALKGSAPAVEKAEPTGPALDMPGTGSQGTPGSAEYKSLAEAMEAGQDAELAKLKK